MAAIDIAQQTVVEQDMLKHLMEGLRVTMAWPVVDGDYSRSLSTLRFIAQSFQRHLERLMTCEEYDGYMDLVLATSPHLSRTVEGLRQEHEQLRAAICQIVLRLEGLAAGDPAAFARVCDDFRGLLQKVEEHNRREGILWQEAFKRDGGGEG
jgi:hypothetical protein